ncbi:cytochrome c biogenesis protein ResB [Xylophilus rhododendri]|uniref:Cytochrome c biogenesis protein ResB n=1 Tax=Xylophilus rhododendri TaxID=2697032 RepID=A0A857J4U5_9BURK|nr:cytochrome c biogenesis protein ResB [Xylophilus rhododendri]QHI98233.1 cytochrome c biogenesis protein ResB [Xylophilus rhododendri]
MSVSTHGIRVRSASAFVRSGVELLSSMRFAISLLSLICIASVIGTVLQQQQPYGNYVNQFGPFWAEVFDAASLYRVYSAWWFLLILAFLVTSTSLCIARSAPKILADLRIYKENLRVQSLRAFGQRAEAVLPDAPEAAARRLGGALVGAGWRVRLQERPGQGWMLAAKAGAAHKLGYIAAHSAIVLVCIGGLLDGDLVVRAQMLLHGKTAYRGGGTIAEVAPQHRLSPSNPTFRGNLLVSEGTQSSSAILNQSDGILVQDLPFSIELKKFIVEHYSTGMPKLFASDIVIHDRDTGQAHSARVEVNHPVSWRGVEIYQSSFDDGGSQVKLKAVPMQGAAADFEVNGTIGESTTLDNRQGGKMTLEFAALRTINVENFGANAGANAAGGPVDVRKVDLRQQFESRIGAPNRPNADRALRNVGPSITYRLRDAAGQATEFQNYMLPVDLGEGVPVFLFGLRTDLADAFRYLRLPADENGSLDGFMRLHAALADPKQREQAVRRYVSSSVDSQRPELAEQLQASALRALSLFAGDPQAPEGSPQRHGGLQAISQFMEANVPEAERSRAGEVLVRILNGCLFELLQQTRSQAGLKPLDAGEATTRAFLTQAVLSLGDMALYPVPMAFRLDDFKQVQASVFQVTRAPGRIVVYGGCALLILGVFSMLFVRERRLWIWLAPSATGGSDATMALSANRKTLDADREFDRLRERLLASPT